VPSEEIILYEGLVVLVLVLGFGVWELFSLKRANREAREKESREKETQERVATPKSRERPTDGSN